MQNRNWVMLGIAVVIGLFAVLLANAWFSGVEQQQGGSAQGQPAAGGEQGGWAAGGHRHERVSGWFVHLVRFKFIV